MSGFVRGLIWTLLCSLTAVPLLAAEPAPATGEVQVDPVTPKAFEALLAEHKGKVILIDFWATYCRPCIKELPHSVALQKQFGEQGLVVITMAMEDAENLDSVRAVLKKAGATHTKNILDADGGTGESFTAYAIDDGALPHYRLYGRDGKLIRKFVTSNLDGDGYKVEDIDAGIVAALKK